MSESVIEPTSPRLTHRQRFLRCMHFQSVDRVPHWEFGYLDETLQRWHAEGLPPEHNNNWSVEAYFGVDPVAYIPLAADLNPPFQGETVVVEDRGRTRLLQYPDGSIVEVGKEGQHTIPHYVKFPIATRDDWKRFKERLNPDDPARHQTDYREVGRGLVQSDLPIHVGLGSFFGTPRNWIGFENIALMCYDDRPLVEEIVATLSDLHYSQLKKALRHCEADFAGGWEDICFRNGPMISPRMFREICGPYIKRACDLLRQHGCDVIYTDCDGDVTALVPIWQECGMHAMFPLEVHPGSDPVKYRRMYGHDIQLRGGIDKRKLAGTRQDILNELRRVEKLVEDGAFIPHGDHRIPEDVSYDNYKYYVREKLALLGWRSDEVAGIEPLRNVPSAWADLGAASARAQTSARG